MAKLGEDEVMVADGMVQKGASIRQVARQLGVTEGALRYRLRKRAGRPQVDGRSRQPTGVDGYEDAIQAVLEELDYQIVSRQDLTALETPPDEDGRFQGSTRIADPQRFWENGRFLIIVQR